MVRRLTAPAAKVRRKLDAAGVTAPGLSVPRRLGRLGRLLWSPFGVEPYSIGERAAGRLLFLLAWPRIVVAMRRRTGRTELWIGDSHAMYVNRRVSNGMVLPGPDGQVIVRAGARIMYSLARNGFPPRVMRVARFVHRFGRPGAIVPVFSAGEIDIRAHLARHPDPDFGFVTEYVQRCREVADLLKADRLGIMVPTPPVDLTGRDVWFPVAGSLDERLHLHKLLRDALAAAVERVPGAVLIDFTDVLAGPSGAMPFELSSDGAHVSPVALPMLRARVATSGLLATDEDGRR